jgi:hypothetical protein
VVFSFTSLRSSAALDEGVDRMETLMRLARAQAATAGRPVQVVITPATGVSAPLAGGHVRVQWEPDPWQHPGEFKEIPGVQRHAAGVAELVEVISVAVAPEVPSSSPSTSNAALASPLTAPSESAGETRSTRSITFQPDGSSDSAQITLVSRDSGDSRQVTIRIDGLTGATRRAEPTPAEESAVGEEPAFRAFATKE